MATRTTDYSAAQASNKKLAKPLIFFKKIISLLLTAG
jgi:hypothetical protein